jgi:hypothetical protein
MKEGLNNKEKITTKTSSLNFLRGVHLLEKVYCTYVLVCVCPSAAPVQIFHDDIRIMLAERSKLAEFYRLEMLTRANKDNILTDNSQRK